MEPLELFHFPKTAEAEKKVSEWIEFLKKHNFDFGNLKKIDFGEMHPKIYDLQGNKFCINFLEDRQNYHKKKLSLKKELLGRAMGSGRYGMKVLDLSAGLAIDSIFLMQLGFQVTAVERNPLIFLALKKAAQQLSAGSQIQFVYSDALKFLKEDAGEFDVIYFDPMFPEKIKSALPKQEMVVFRNLVGADLDGDEVVAAAVHKPGIKRVVVKRPLKAPTLYKKPVSQIEGKLVRFDIYGVEK